MAFKRQLEADLLAWDPQAGGAALVAQVLIMGGVLRPDFDTRQFDTRLNRRARTHLKIAVGMRVMAAALPTLTLTDVGRTSAEDFLDPKKMRAEWLQQGVPSGKIDRYLKSKLYANAKLQAESFMAAGKLMGPKRFKSLIVPQPRVLIEQLLLNGAVAVTPDAESRSGQVMLLMSKRSPGKVRAYFPEEGTILTTMDELHKQGVINLDHFGATVHAM